jgi:hypothetical protein
VRYIACGDSATTLRLAARLEFRSTTVPDILASNGAIRSWVALHGPVRRWRSYPSRWADSAWPATAVPNVVDLSKDWVL